MCGISMFFARESKPDYEIIEPLFKWSEKRGTDGFGISIIKRSEPVRKITTYRSIYPYSTCKGEVKSFVKVNFDKGDLLLSNARAAPEQEPPTTETNMQPIVNDGVVVVHNGSVSNFVCVDLKNWSNNTGKFKFNTQIDSEAIIAEYIRQDKNIKDTCEHLSGGFAAILYDIALDRVYYWTDFKPLAHMAIRGIGYGLSSSNDCLTEIINSVCDCTRNGEAIWEDFYNHYLRGQRIKSLDLDSGFIRNIKFSPRFVTQNFDTNFDNDGNRR